MIHFENLIKIKPDWSDAYYGASLSQFKLGLYDKALITIDKALALMTKDTSLTMKHSYYYVKAITLKK